MNFNIFYLLFFVYISIKSSSSERLREQIYSTIEGVAACFRRLNGTHQAGCSSPINGAVGVVQMIQEVSDAYWLTQNATAGPYVAFINTAKFHNVIEILIGQPDNIAGVLLYDNANESVNAFSLDSKCPNEYSSGPGSTCSLGSEMWNARGNNLLKRDIPFPIFFLPESGISEVTKIQSCYKRFNLERDNQKGMPLCSLQMQSFMYAAGDSITCMRRSASTTLVTNTIKICDPLGDSNVYYSLFPRIKKNKTNKKPVILVSARIDSASLFDGLSPGAASSVVGTVTLISAAATLSQMITDKENNTYDKNVLWTLFNGEAFDYIGSQRVAYDISQGRWPQAAPLSPTDVPLHLELGQIGGALVSHQAEQDWPFSAYTPVNVNNIDKISELFNDLKSDLNSYKMNLSLISTENLPPSSLHSFRRILSNYTDSGAITQVVISDHEKEFTNMFYNSALDVYTRIGFVYHNITIAKDGTFNTTDELITNGTMKQTEAQVKIAYLATAVARTLYKNVVGQSYVGDLAASAHLVDEMLYCFLRSQACQLLRAADYATGDGNLPEKPAPLYVGVTAWAGTASVFAGHLFALLTGTHLNITKMQCDTMDNADYSYYWLKGWNHTGVCIQTTMNFSQAMSPAFIKEDYDFRSGEFSTWTESVWQSMSMRVFVSAGGAGARVAAGAGATATLLAAALTFWLRRHAHRVFVQAPAGSLPSAHTATGILRSVNC